MTSPRRRPGNILSRDTFGVHCPEQQLLINDYTVIMPAKGLKYIFIYEE